MAMKRLNYDPETCERQERRKMIFANVAKFEEKGIAVTVNEELENQEAHNENRPVAFTAVVCRQAHEDQDLPRRKGLDPRYWTQRLTHRRPQLDEQLGRSSHPFSTA